MYYMSPDEQKSESDYYNPPLLRSLRFSCQDKFQ